MDMRMNGLLILTLYLFLVSCDDCNQDQIICPGLSENYVKMLHYNEGDSITYVCQTGRKMVFVVEHLAVTTPEIIECYDPGAYRDCYCGHCETPEGSYASNVINDTTWDGYGFIGRSISEYDVHRVLINMAGANSVIFNLSPFQLLLPSQEILHGFQTPNRLYDKVIHQVVDTSFQSNISPPIPYVTDIYVTIDRGVVAYKDRLSGCLFYLE